MSATMRLDDSTRTQSIDQSFLLERSTRFVGIAYQVGGVHLGAELASLGGVSEEGYWTQNNFGDGHGRSRTLLTFGARVGH
jgi:hypothetical protein